MSTPAPVPDNKGKSDGDDARTAGLRRAAHARTTRAEKAADAAIRDLVKRNATINFTAVARVAGVTPAFLHRHPELASRIRELSRSQSDASREQTATTATGESAIIVALRRRLREEQERHKTVEKELRAQVVRLEAQVAVLYGRMGGRPGG